MKNGETIYPKARIPYGTWGSSYFPAWQTSALAEVNIGQFAGEAMSRIMGLRKVPMHTLDYLVSASTLPWRWKFWTSTFLSHCAGHRLPGYHIEQACATGLQAILLAGNEVQNGGNDAVGVLTFDRTSDSTVGIFPERRAHERTFALNDVWENFGYDPATTKSMLATGGNAARKHKLDRKEVDELTFCRYEQYFAAKASGFLNKVLVPMDVLDNQGKFLGRVDDDFGIRKVTLAGLRELRELDACVTSGTQTHPADGMATILVASKEKAAEISLRPEIDIQFVAKAEIRAMPVMMPEAPTLAVQKLFARTGFKIEDIAVIKDHNPFAVNDMIFSKVFKCDWRKMNNTGCSLVWGHPQGPTLTRTTIEGLEEAVDIGGGYVLIFGCAAGDVGIAAIFKVTERR